MNKEKFIRGIPKADLHMHVEGAIEPEMAIALAQRNGVDLPYRSADELKAALDFQCLQSFLAVLKNLVSLLIHEQDFYEVTFNYLKKSSFQNVAYADLMFDPQAHMSRGVAFDTVIQGIHRAQQDAENEFGIRSQLIMNFQRDASIESAEQALDEALRYRDRIVAVGLDNTELPQFYTLFTDLFRRARAAGFKLTSHCDVDEPTAVDHIRGCFNQLQVDRLDHGVNVLEDEQLMEQARSQQICFTACPTTDYITVKDPLSDPYVQRVSHAAKAMLEAGLCVTVNTDDPGIMGGRYINDILIDLDRLVTLSKAEIVQLMRNAFNSIWVNEQERQDYLTALENYAETYANHGEL
jgi:adenosine deaminase